MSKTYNHRGYHKHKSKTKKRWFIYYYDEDWNFKTEKVNWLQAMFYKSLKVHRYRRYCRECGNVFFVLAQSRKQQLECPNCGE